MVYWGISLSGKKSFTLRQGMLEIMPTATRVTTVVEIWDTLFDLVENTFLSRNHALWLLNYTA